MPEGGSNSFWMILASEFCNSWGGNFILDDRIQWIKDYSKAYETCPSNNLLDTHQQKQ